MSPISYYEGVTSGRKPEESGEWEYVRDSWVSPVPAPQPQPQAAETTKPPTVPPPLDSSNARQAELMLERLAAGDYEGAALAADAILRRDPKHVDARQCADIADSELRRVYLARLGSGARVPRRVTLPDTGAPQQLDATVRLVLSQVDGSSTVDAIVGSGLLSPQETLRILSEAYLRGLVVLG